MQRYETKNGGAVSASRGTRNAFPVVVVQGIDSNLMASLDIVGPRSRTRDCRGLSGTTYRPAGASLTWMIEMFLVEPTRVENDFE